MMLIDDAFSTLLKDIPKPFRSVDEVAAAMRLIVNAGLDELPLPGSGYTLERWRALASAGALDLSLAKIYEGHTDALAILEELGGEQTDGLCGVWAAETPSARVIFREEDGGGTLEGRKPYCSGCSVVDFALVTAWNPEEKPVLARVHMRQPGVKVDGDSWQALGMAACNSGMVSFAGARGEMVGAEGAYLARPGFWQGGAGIAALWYGAAAAVARPLCLSSRIASDPHAAAHLGTVDTALRGAKALLLEAAGWIDAHPTADASLVALRLRAGVEAAANEVLLRTGRALGPGPLCNDAIHAQRCADLPVFLRQSHAEHDLEALGRGISADFSSWNL